MNWQKVQMPTCMLGLNSPLLKVKYSQEIAYKFFLDFINKNVNM